RPKVPSTYMPSSGGALTAEEPPPRRLPNVAFSKASTAGSNSTERCTNSIDRSERKVIENVRHALGQILGFAALQRDGIPQLEMATHAQQHDFLAEPCGTTQFGCHQNAPRTVDIDVLGISQHESLQDARTCREAGDLFAFDFPHGAGVDQQASIRVAGERQLTTGLVRERVTMPGRYGKPTLSIQRESAAALEQDEIPTFVHIILLSPTLRDRKSTRLNSSHVKISYAVFCLKKKNRIHYVMIVYINTFQVWD